ncbi:MAG: glycosyltransferase family 2 protein [Magnetococcales bacterium]|nr:glycosyltransferase family 2 protein [Magnetococcales bacterium]
MTLIIPAFNEAEAIGDVLAELHSQCPHLAREILVIDDGSTDGTAQVAEQAGARVIRHSRNKGYGAALKTGIRAAGTEWVLTLDADGQHRAMDAQRLWETNTGTWDMVVGKRPNPHSSPLWRRPGKWLLGRLANYLTGIRIPDLNSGLRLLRRSVGLTYLRVCPQGFSFSTTLTLALLTQGHDIHYLPIETRKRTGRSTVRLSTGFETIILILRTVTLFSPLRLFLPISLVLGILGILWGLPYALAGRGISVGALLVLLTALILFLLGLVSDQISRLRLERFD